MVLKSACNDFGLLQYVLYSCYQRKWHMNRLIRFPSLNHPFAILFRQVSVVFFLGVNGKVGFENLSAKQDCST